MDEVISVVGAELQYQFQCSSSEQRKRGFLVDATLEINPLVIHIAFNDDWYVWKVIATTEDGEEIDETELWGDKLDSFLTEF